jgi:rubredoxin
MRCSLCNYYLELLGQLGKTKQYRCRGCGMIFSRAARQPKPPVTGQDQPTQRKQPRSKPRRKEP